MQTDLALTNVTGTFAANGPGCAYTYCLETSFEIDGGAPFGLISVELTAIPEPSTALLVAFGVASLAVAGRRSRDEAPQLCWSSSRCCSSARSVRRCRTATRASRRTS